MRKVITFPGSLSVKPHIYKYWVILLMGSLLLASALISCSHQVQNPRRRPEAQEAKTADQIISEMKPGLRLTDEQEVNIHPIVEEQVRKRDELIKKYKGRGRQGMDSLRDELKGLRIGAENRLQYFLTNEQMIKYGYMHQEEDQRISSEKTQEEQGQRMHKGRGRRSGNPER